VSAFERLTEPLQYQVVHTLGFTGLRPVQELSTAAILDGHNVVVLAPTAGGKTEAAFFPLISQMDQHDWRPVSVLYLSPIRALLNNQEDRVKKLADLVGRRAFKWHGDTTQSERKKFIREPTDILLITPESLEAMMMSRSVPARELLAHVRAVIVDEVHAFADDDRGSHLSALLERVTRFCGNDVQRIGLSATVGNPEEILRFMQGSSARTSVVVDPLKPPREPAISLDYVGNLDNAALVIKALHPGKKRLVFVDSRRVAEELGKLLLAQDVDTFVIHGSLSVTQRRDAEQAFAHGQNCVIVATSALELGIDVGDLDHVLQIDSPPSVASFLQRMGRTGRRPETISNCTLLLTKENTALQAAAIVDLHRQGYVEPVRPDRRAAHIYAHQVMALAIQSGGLPRADLEPWLRGATAFADLSEAERDQIIDHMLATTVLSDDGDRVWLGSEGEKRYGRANFMNLYAVFDVPRLISVRHHLDEIGQVDATFLRALQSKDEGFGSFVLGGRAWQITFVDWERGRCIVEPAPEGRAARWSGGPRFLSYELCQAMKRILLSESDDPAWSARTRNVIAGLRSQHSFLTAEGTTLLEGTTECTWQTFAGGAANNLLARLLEAELGPRCTARNTSIVLKEDAAKSAAAIRAVVARFHEQSRPDAADVARVVDPKTSARISKFEPCLPEALLQNLVSSALFDLDAARRVVAEPLLQHD
jgi:ATP-dependent Lhr-like helicase